MTLTIKERLLLLNALPREGDITTIRILRQLRESLSFSEEDHTRLGIKLTSEGHINWSKDVPQDTEVEIGHKAATEIEKVLRELSVQKKLAEEHLTLWDKFCPET